MTIRWFLAPGLFAAVALALTLSAGTAQDKKVEPKKSDDKKAELRKGTVTGVVVNKKDNWVEIKADGEEKARKYFAPPKTEEVNKAVKATEIGSRVQADWTFGGEAYIITKYEVIKKPVDSPAKKDEPKKDEPKKDEARKGTVTGVLTAKGENWIEVKADGEEKARRYVPHWKGGAPAAGGGPDKEMVAKLKEIPLNSRVKMEWIFEERPRVEKIEVLKKGEPDKKP